VTSSTRALAGGFYQINAQYAGDGTFARSLSTPVSVTVNPENSATTMQALLFDPISGNLNPFTSASAGSLIYLRADVAGASGFGTASGNVTFTDNGTDTIAGSPFVLNSQGNTATPNGITTLAGGPHSIVASYSGDNSFHTSASSAVTFNITDFSLSFGSPTINISAPGASGSTDLTVNALGGFTDTVAFTCSGLPRESTCGFSPLTLTGGGTTTLTVTTTASHNAMLQGFGKVTTSLAITLFGTVVLLPYAKKKRWTFLLGLLVLGLLVALPACGGGSSTGPTKDPGTPVGDSTVTVTATTPHQIHTSTFLLHVQ